MSEEERGAFRRFVDMTPAFEAEQLAIDGVVMTFANNRTALIQAVPWLERTIRDAIGPLDVARPCWVMVQPGRGFRAGLERFSAAPTWWKALHLAREHGIEPRS